MNNALKGSARIIAVCSQSYIADQAEYSLLEWIQAIWSDARGHERRLVPVIIEEIAEKDLPPLLGLRSFLTVLNESPEETARKVLEALQADEEKARQREAEDFVASARTTPQIFNVPRLPLPHFVGRDRDLETVRETLERRQTVVVSALTGMGGIGKTTLASEYAHRFGTAGRYAGVWWVPAESESGLVASLGELAKRLGHSESQDLPAMARWAVDKVGQSGRPWLIIFDNVPNADALRYRQPQEGLWVPSRSARTLITSRRQDFGGMAETTALDKWSTETTAGYLIEETGRDDEAGAKALAETLDGLPLAAEQAAGYLRDRGKSFADYATDIETMIQRERDAGNTGDYPQTVYATLVTSLDRLIADGHAATVDLLCLLAWLAPEGTEIALIEAAAQWKAEHLSELLAAVFADEDARDDTIRAAVVLSLLVRATDEAGVDMLALHRIAATVLRAWQRITIHSCWSTRAAELVKGFLPDGEAPAHEPSVWPLCARALPHVHALAKHAPRSEALAYALNQAALFVDVRGDQDGAIALLELSLSITLDLFGELHQNASRSLSSLASIYSDCGRLKEAEKAFERVVAIDEKFRPDDPVIAEHYNNLGKVRWRLGDFTTAEQLLLKARAISEAASGYTSIQMVWRLSALGVLYDTWANEPGQGHRRGKARRLNVETIRLARALRGERHPDVAAGISNLAVLLARQKRFGCAAALTARAAAINLSLGLLNDPHTQERLVLLCNFWKRRGQIARAEKLRRGDFSDLYSEIAEVEWLMRKWVAEDQENRRFGPRSFGEHAGTLWCRQDSMLG